MMPPIDVPRQLPSSRPWKHGWATGAFLRLARVVAGITLVSSLVACTAFDPLDSTGETINRNATDYANDAILMNIVRSELYEPLSFITITSVQGSSTASGALGFGGFLLGPAKPPVTYLLGPASAGRTNTNIFNISVVDDPASFAALLAPVSPATIGFFINQGYPRELLFFLLTDRLRQVEEDPKTGRVTKVIHEYYNHPNREADPEDKDLIDFTTKMSTLLASGLTAQIDITGSPAGRAVPPSKLCLDPSLPQPGFAVQSRMTPLPAVTAALCENAPWIAAKSAATAAPSSGGSSGAE